MSSSFTHWTPSSEATLVPRFTPWTQLEEETIVHRREGDGWKWREIAIELPLRSEAACRKRYLVISGRRLKTEELEELTRLWEA